MSDTMFARRPMAQELADFTVNEFVAAYPEAMSVLARLGIDLCCGGLIPLGEALARHGYDQAATIERIRALIDKPIGLER